MSKNFGGYKKGGYIPESKHWTTNGWEKETVEDVLTYPILPVPQQNIGKIAAHHFGIRSRLSSEDGETIIATYFPYYSQEGKLTGFKKRDWTIQKEESGHFTVVGVVKTSSMLFGQQLCKGHGKRVHIAEGEGDVVACWQVMMSDLKKRGVADKYPPEIVGLNCGAGNAQEAIAHNEKFVRNHEQIILCLDNDEATKQEARKNIKKGKEAKEDIAAFLLTENIYTIDLPEGYKDPRSMLNGKRDELLRLLCFDYVIYSPEKIVSGDDADLDELIEPLKEGFYIKRHPKLMAKLHGLRTGNELITYAAFSGVGKSTLNMEFMWELDKAGYKVGGIFLEQPLKKTQQGLLALQLGIPLNRFRENPLAVATREVIAQAKSEVLSNGRTFFLDHFGSMKVEKLMQQIRYLHFICGCEHIFIDHISMVVAGNESNNERKDIDMLYEELASFMTVNPVTIHAVCHLKRVDDPKLGKQGKKDEEPQPYWREVRKEMLRGSSGIECMSSIIIMLENEVMPDGSRGRVRTRLEKNREWSELGICDTLIMKGDGRLYSEEQADIPQDVDYIGNSFVSPEMPELNDPSFNVNWAEDPEIVESF